MTGRWVACAAVMAAAAAVVAGCAASPSAAPAQDAEVATRVDCLAPQVLRDLGLGDIDARPAAARTPHPDAPAAGRVPDGFAAESVVECSVGGRLRDGTGVWSAVTQTRLEGDLAPVLTALERPSATRRGQCDGPAPGRTVVWLLDAVGRAVRVSLPTDRCGWVARGVLSALAELDATDSADYPVALVEPAPSVSGTP